MGAEGQVTGGHVGCHGREGQGRGKGLAELALSGRHARHHIRLAGEACLGRHGAASSAQRHGGTGA